MRENADVKGHRYVLEGRLLIERVDGDTVMASCRGQGEVHQLGHDPRGGWFCSCAARGVCAHLTALQLVTVRRSR